MKFLSPENLKIWRMEDDSLVMKIDGHKRFLGPPRRALPISDAERWIIFSDSDGQEIGILPSLEDLPDETRELLNEQLKREYILERITKIINVEREPLTGQTHWRVELAPLETSSNEEADVVAEETSSVRSLLQTDFKTLVSNANSASEDGEKTGALSKVANKILQRDRSDEEPSHLERTFTISGQEDVSVARYPQIFIIDTERRRYEIPNCDKLDLDSRRAAERFF